jgi:hypothetical protein
MPRRRKSLTELAATGTLYKHLGRYQARIASKGTIALPIGPAPRALPAFERSIWAEVVRNAPVGSLTKSDRVSFEVLVKLTAKMRKDAAKPSEINTLIGLLGKFGLIPADRVRLDMDSIPDPAAESEEDKAWDALDELD